MKILQIRNLYKKYAQGNHFAIRNLSLDVEPGQIMGLVGESGSGKTTLLRLIAGFELPDQGSIIINGQTVVNEKIYLAPEKRKVGMVFQDYALFPHLTIEDNISFGLQQYPSQGKKDRVHEMLKLVGLQGFQNRYPHQLSGGQQQRIALARALAPRPNLILLDEPFSNLDTVLKDRVREDIREIIKNTGTTAIFVTHDTKDALSIADTIAVIRDGNIEQTGDPEELYNLPANSYVANFFGKVNVFYAYASPNNGFDTPMGFIPSPVANGHEGKVLLAIRPENIAICNSEESNLKGTVIMVDYQGAQKQVHLYIQSDQENINLCLNTKNDQEVIKGDNLCFKVNPDKIRILETCFYLNTPSLQTHKLDDHPYHSS